MTRKFNRYEITPADIAQMVREGTAFKAGALTGTPDADAGTGQLPVPIGDEYRRTVRAGIVMYVISSYATPIAWVTRHPSAAPTERGNVTWTQPEVTYSATTRKHQKLVERAAVLVPS